MLREPPDILITTPESLFLLLTSQARETAAQRRDADPRRGARRRRHEAGRAPRALRRAAGALLDEPVQRIGLSATQRPLEEIGRFVAGGRPIELVDAGAGEGARPAGRRAGRGHARARRRTRLPARAERPGLGVGADPSRASIWPSIYPEVLRLVEQHRSTIVFVNNRRLAERLALRLNELAERELARAHHGSLAREQRLEIEELLKRGEIPCLVATSSLELGIDMGAVDLVIQVESPKSVARGLQRIGRAGHELGAVSKGRIFPKFRADLLESAVVAGGCGPARSRRRSSRATRSTCSHSRSSRSAPTRRSPSTICTSSCAARTRSPISRARSSRTCSTCSRAATRPTSSPSCGRASSGTGRPARSAAARRAQARGHERRDDPRPRPLRRPPRRRRRPGGRARRGDGLRGARGADVPARRLDVADRGDHARPRARLAGAGRARGGAVLEGRGRRAAVRAGRGDRPRLARADGALGREGARRLRGELLARRARREEPPDVPARAGGGDRRRPLRPHGRRRALPRRDRRLARLHPDAVRRRGCTRRGRWRSRRGCASRSGSRRSRSGRTTGSRSISPTPTRRRRPTIW